MLLQSCHQDIGHTLTEGPFLNLKSYMEQGAMIILKHVIESLKKLMAL